MTRKWPVLAVVLAILWVAVRGPETLGAVPAEILIGIAFGTPVAYGFRSLYADTIDLRRMVRVAPYAALYAGAFIAEVVTANLDVAYRVLAPSMPIEPAVIVLPLRVETDAAVTTIANSITLTPGTLTMDFDEDAHALYIHAIDGRDPGSVVAPIRAWEDYALVIFDEEGQPGDPAPAPFEYRRGRDLDSTEGPHR